MSNRGAQKSAILFMMIYRWWPNLRYAVLGLKVAWRNEAHFRVHTIAQLAIFLPYILTYAAG